MDSSNCDQNFRVCLVGGMEKWENKKVFNFPPCLVGSRKIEKWKK